MIRRLRTSAPARAALCMAALFSVVAAFGLHPEPADGAGAPLGQRIAVPGELASSSHGCTACLHAGSAVVAMTIRLSLSTDSARATRLPLYVAPSAGVPHARRGRSPPSDTPS